MVTEVAVQKSKLTEILLKYDVEKSDEIEKMIAEGKIPAHPAYEDYLSALSYEQNLSELKKEIGAAIEGI